MSEKGRATIIFSLKNEVGGLVKALKLFQVTQLSNVNKTLYANIGICFPQFPDKYIIALFVLACVHHADRICTANSQLLLQESHVNLVHIESRKSKRRNSEFEIFVDCDSNHEQLNEIIQLLQKNVNVLDMEPADNSCLHKEGE